MTSAGLRSDDPVIWNSWHVVADETALRSGDTVHTKLLGIDMSISKGPDGAVRVRRDDAKIVEEDVQYGLVWACLGVPREPILSIPEFFEGSRCIVTGGAIGIHASAGRVVENFLDLGHLGYVHAGYLGAEPDTEVLPYSTTTLASGGVQATGCKVFQPNASPTATSGYLVEYSYKVERPFTASLYKSSFSSPERFDVIYLFVQPVSEERSIAHTLEIFVDDGIMPRELRAFQQLILLQDKPILENQDPKLLPIGPRMEMPVSADKTSIAYRRWLAELGITYGTIGANPIRPSE